MDVKLNSKTIKEMCGTVSFKRGDSFYRAGKVKVIEESRDRCVAIVKGVEDFHVTIEKHKNGSILSTCSCPTLPNVKLRCQHTAAVLIALLELKKQKITMEPAAIQPYEGLMANQFISLFTEKEPVRKSGRARHFEKRKVLEARVILKPIALGDDILFGIKAEVAETKVQNIREFLLNLGLGLPSQLTPTVQFDPDIHCFANEVDSLLHHLGNIVKDEVVYLDALTAQKDVFNEYLIIPPSAWRGLHPLISEAAFVMVEQDDYSYEKLDFGNGPTPLKVFIEEDESNSHYQLTMQGFEQFVVMEAYHLVLSKGTIYQLDGQDCDRLIQLRQMLESSGKNAIPIHTDQLAFFLEKVVPGVKRIGDVKLSRRVTQILIKTSLEAKIYLDRLKNRLLAGLEFHYENIIIQPLENRDLPIGQMITRDLDKEEEILALMEESGFTITEGGYFMQNEELEYEFLYHALPKLQKLAHIYATTAVRNRIARTSSFPRIKVKVPEDRMDWLEFKFEMDGINDKQIKELLQALEIKQKYYRLPNGSLLSLETKEMEEIRRFLNAVPFQENDFESTLNMPIMDGLKFLDFMDESEVFRPEESFRRFVDDLLHPRNLEYEVPPNLNHILRDYQKQGFKWMKALANYGFGGILADDMGLGKTLQSIAFIVSELEQIGEHKLPVLIVCPSSLTYNWLYELAEFAPELQVIVIDGKKADRVKCLHSVNEMDVIITSYPLLRKDLNWYEKQSFHTVFFDEAQYFKNPYTQTARAVKKIKAQHRFGLTGTPIENSLEELWSLYHVVFPQLFQGLEEYSHLPRKAIARRVKPFLLRRMKEDVLPELPQKHETLEFSELLPEQKKLYTAFLAKLRHETLKHLDKETFQKNRIRILAGLTRLRQICCHPALFVEGYEGSSAKFSQLLQLLEEAHLSGRRVLIFSQFTKMLELIGKELTRQGKSYFYLDGQTPPEDRVSLCSRFNEGERDLFLISLKAGGTGLNLTGADTVILYDLWWNPAVEDQAADRAYRMGQKNEVDVIKLVSKGTIEEKMNQLQEKKKNLISEVIEWEGKDASSLTEEDIREILMI
ncbi:helicase SNF [Lysinibacillus yapensis]|uniref:Helicase SNF n=1 Tax=Ureibacillus yapensis TaxID=2304605 RepID=A0A396SEE6_9BACL|nr:DEAD/DEAH box helicase [Lysinibacillus yapensis]RHW36582.1 helicase SNF [Lysinibacillus yapensis]